MSSIARIQEGVTACPALADKDIAGVFDFFIRLYVSERIDQTNIEEDGDMLLYQWSRQGGHVELDLTRQIMLDLEDPDEAADSMTQLSIKFRFAETADAPSMGSGNVWCNSPVEVEAFRAMLGDSALFSWARQVAVAEVQVTLDRL